MNEALPVGESVTRSEIPAAFGRTLYGRTSREDLAQYEPRALAALAEAAWRHLIEPREPGRHSLRLIDPEGDRQLAGVTIIQVVNDDMPFLLDFDVGRTFRPGPRPASRRSSDLQGRA